MPEPEAIALERIRRAAVEGATVLDLSDLGLTALPPEIGALTSLTELDLSRNQLTALPPAIGALASLTALDLSRNRLTALPPEIGSLTSLTELDLAGNRLTALPPELWRLPNLTGLDISDNPLPVLPPELWQKTDWQELGLAGLNLTALPPEIGALTRLTELDLWNNRLTALPPEIGSLTRLTELVLSENHLTALPSELWRLPNLTRLDISYNPLPELPPELWQRTDWQALGLAVLNLTALPPEIGSLTSLTELDLSGNQLTALPPAIGALASLTELDLSVNELTALPPEIGALTRLTVLNLGSNQLTALPPEIGALTRLTELYLAGNRLIALPLALWRLPNLTGLDISDNPLPALPPELWQKTDWQELGLAGLNLTALPPEIGNLPSLTVLNLGSNQLTALPPEIGSLTRLTRLYLRGNQLTALPPEIGALTRLTELNLAFNQLSALPPEIGSLTGLQRLNLHGNPLTLALPRALLGHEVFGRDAGAILRFYRAVWEGGAALGEARLLFVGQPAVGKTSLVHRLLDGSYDPHRPSTMTVETHALPLGGWRAQVWDFGGQDFMHATHPFFFSARCVYVLVLNVRQTYEQNRVEYWLRTIRAFGGESPVIVVGNHADAAQHVLDLPQNRLRRDFPAIAAFLQTSAAEDDGIPALRAALSDAVNALPHVRVRFAQTHLRVKTTLEREKQTHDIIPYSRYADLCAAQDITDEGDQRALLALLHDLGVVFDFRNEDGEPLSPDGVLNPNWVTEAVYRVITDQELRGPAAGRLTREMTRRILRDYKTWHRNLIVNLMQRFELAYPAPDGAWYLPNAMPQDEPAAASDSAWDVALTFRYAYPELPESVITRFIVRAHEWIDAGLVWRWGVILAWNANRALVRADAAAKTVEMRVIGQEHTRREMLASLRIHFDAIHKTFTESAGKEAFPIKSFLCPPRYPGLWLDYEKLLTYERDGLTEIPETWQGRTIRLNVSEILNGFVTPEARREERKRLFPEEERRMRDEDERRIHVEIHGSMTGSSLVIGKDNRVQQTIQDSFNTASPELQQTLQALTAAVEAMLVHLSPEEAEDARDNLEHLQEELQKPRPSKKWYRVSIEGLIKAAENVGKVGAPVITLAGKLLALLGKLP